MDQKKIEEFRRFVEAMQAAKKEEQRRQDHAHAAMWDKNFHRFMARVLRPVL